MDFIMKFSCIPNLDFIGCVVSLFVDCGRIQVIVTGDVPRSMAQESDILPCVVASVAGRTMMAKSPVLLKLCIGLSTTKYTWTGPLFITLHGAFFVLNQQTAASFLEHWSGMCLDESIGCNDDHTANRTPLAN